VICSLVQNLVRKYNQDQARERERNGTTGSSSSSGGGIGGGKGGDSGAGGRTPARPLAYRSDGAKASPVRGPGDGAGASSNGGVASPPTPPAAAPYASGRHTPTNAPDAAAFRPATSTTNPDEWWDI